MKNLIIIISVVLIGCGRDYNVSTIDDNEQETISYEHIYSFGDGSYIEVFDSEYELYIPNNGQYLTSINPENDTIGEFPPLGLSFISKKLINKGTFIITKNLNFTTGHDIEEDVNGSNIIGQKRVDIKITFSGDKIVLNLKVYDNRINSNVNEIIVDRTFRSL